MRFTLKSYRWKEGLKFTLSKSGFQDGQNGTQCATSPIVESLMGSTINNTLIVFYYLVIVLYISDERTA